MDYFINVPADTRQLGLIDPYLRVGVSPLKNFKTTLDAHKFYLANADVSDLNKIQKSLGNEFDLSMEYQSSPIMNIQLGYSMMFATKIWNF